MKSSLLLIVGMIFGILLRAQRFSIVDSEMILSKIPEYNQAQKQLDQLSNNWAGEVQISRLEIKVLQKAYDAEKILLTEEMQEERLTEIKEKETEARGLQSKYFGPEGEIYKKRKEFVQPIQDQIYNAVREVARRRKLDVVFDKSSDLITLYNSDKVDISDEVLKKLGY